VSAAGSQLPFSAAAERNAGPILERLQGLLPARANVLEIASGTGQHAARFAAEHAGWTWQPTEAAEGALPAIAARCAGLAGVRRPLVLDVMAQPWPVPPGAFDAVYCANLIHVAPWPACAALMSGAAQALSADGALVLYGPYLVDGEAVAPGNRAFDADLRARDPAWGLRRLATVADEAGRAGLALDRRFDMPANNLLLVFRRSQPPG
jgi:SAM-dependent methyltransferase